MPRHGSWLWIYAMWGLYGAALVLAGQHHWILAFAAFIAGTWSAVRT